MYDVRVKASVEKDLARLPREVISRILETIEALAEVPVPHGARKLTGANHLYRIRVGEYRIVYEVLHDDQQVLVVLVRHRKTAYRSL